MNLDTASREQLVELIGQLQATIAQLEVRVRELEARVAKGGPPKGMPGHKPEQPATPKATKPRKRRSHGFARVREPVASEQVHHAVDQCPECGITLVGGSVKRTRQVLEVRPSPVQVIEHQYLERRCPQCGKRWVPKGDLAGVVVGQERIGIGLASLIASLREAGRWPIATIRWYLATVHGVRLSVGAIVAVLDRVATVGQQRLEAILGRIRASPVVHGDETGWRQDGHNGYVWTFSTVGERYFRYGGRNKEMVDQVLGEQFSGVLVSDFYAAYNHYAGLKQRCWAHLLREIHELQEAHPEDKALRCWAQQVHDLYAEAKAYAGPAGPARVRAKGQCEQRLWKLCAPAAEDPTAPQRKLCARMQRFIAELFVFVGEPGVPSENNAAERSLRHLVISRKTSGGTRSEKGTATKMALSSLFGTWRAQGLNPWLACQQMLASPQV
jgi:transposase